MQAAVDRLKANLRSTGIPLELLSQYMPRQHAMVQEGLLAADPDALIEAQISAVLEAYESAVAPGG